MALTHAITTVYRTGEGNVAIGSSSVSSDSETNFDGIVTAGATDKEVDWAVTKANVKSLLMYSDQAVTVHQNTLGGTAIALAAAVPLVWDTNSIFSNPLVGDITALHIVNAGVVDANVKIRALLDQTP